MRLSPEQALLPEGKKYGMYTRSLLRLGVCCASCVKPQKTASRAIFYPANSEAALAASRPDNRDFLHKYAKNSQARQTAGSLLLCLIRKVFTLF
jgi:hypothetical protein